MRLLWMLFLLGVVVQGQPLADPAPSGEEGLKARLFATTSRRADFEPCKCPDMPLGGLAQAAGHVDEARVEGPVFWFDAGNRLFRIDMAMTGVQEAVRRATAVALTDAGTVGKLDAAGVGQLDLGAGVEYLQKLAFRAGFPVLSANLVDEQGVRLFDSSLLLERDGMRVGVTSVLPGDSRGPGYEATDPIRAAKDAVKKLRADGAELVVVLSNLGEKGDAKLLRAARPDVVFAARERSVTAQEVGGRWIVEAGSRGKYLAEARWYERGPGKGPHVVGTTVPISRDGPVHPGVVRVVEQLLVRLQDPLLGLPGVPLDANGQPVMPERPERLKR